MFDEHASMLSPGDRVLFLAQRMHTNQLGWFQALQKEGIEVRFYSYYKEITEDYSYAPSRQCIPSLKSLISLVLRRIQIRQKLSSDDLRSIITPSAVHLSLLLLLFRPKVLILRGKKPNLFFDLLAAGLKTAVLIYKQRPVEVKELPEIDLDSPESRKPSVPLPNVRLVRKMARHLVVSPVASTHCSHLSKVDQGIGVDGRSYWLPFSLVTHDLVGRPVELDVARIRLLFVGKFREYKNLPLLLEALALLPTEARGRVSVTLVGQASTDTELKFAKDAVAFLHNHAPEVEVSLKVNFPWKSMPEMYSSHDFLVLPSKNEVAAISPLEGMAFGLIPVITENNGTNCYISDGTTGFFFDPTEPKTLAATLERVLLMDSEQRLTVSNKCRQHSELLLNQEQFFERLKMAVYLENKRLDQLFSGAEPLSIGSSIERLSRGVANTFVIKRRYRQ